MFFDQLGILASIGRIGGVRLKKLQVVLDTPFH